MALTHSPTLTETLFAISRLGTEAEDAPAALAEVARQIKALLPCDLISIHLINPDTGCLEEEVRLGPFPDRPIHPIPLFRGVTGWVATHRRPLLVDEVRLDHRYLPIHPDVQTELAVPIQDGNLLFGVINCESFQRCAFAPTHREYLQAIASETGRIIKSLWRLRQLREQSEHLHRLLRTAEQLVSSIDLHRTIHNITQIAADLHAGSLAALFLLDDNDPDRLILHELSGLTTPRSVGESIDLAQTSLGTVIRRRKQIEVTDFRKTEEHHFVNLAQREQIVSMLATPLSVENKAIGCLNIYARAPHRFTNEEKRHMTALAGLGALAIQNARLYARVFASEETLRRNERLTTLGLLSAEIAHEIRNPLTVIRLLFGSLDLDFPEDDLRNKDLRVITEKLDHLEGTVDRVLQFGKSHQGMRACYDLNSIIQDTLILVRMKMEQSSVACSFEPTSSPLPIRANKGQVQQSLLNLLLNSIQAMTGQHGHLVITTHLAHGAEGQRFAACRITDEGHGIPAEIRENVFESFFTSSSEGTGLGLAITRQLINAHNGKIEIVQSDPAGTTIELRLPLDADTGGGIDDAHS